MTVHLAWILMLAAAPASSARSPLSETELLDRGYRQMYNLQFENAHETFRQWRQSHPDDPLGPTSDAAAYLFSEFDRLGILQSQFFTDDRNISRGPKLTPDPAVKRAFYDSLASSDRLADHILSRHPDDPNALFAKLLNLGLRSDYLALIDKKSVSALAYTKSAGILAKKLLATDPSYYDAYLAVGVENYILGLNPAPVRWLLHLYGAEADASQGIKQLRLTAEKGHYLEPFARLLLAVAALRNRDKAQAKELLSGLAQEFPNNRLYVHELSRLD
jgi:hypothetical protein